MTWKQSRKPSVHGVPCMFVNTRRKLRHQTPTQSAAPSETVVISLPTAAVTLTVWLFSFTKLEEPWPRDSLWEGPGFSYMPKEWDQVRNWDVEILKRNPWLCTELRAASSLTTAILGPEIQITPILLLRSTLKAHCSYSGWKMHG